MPPWILAVLAATIYCVVRAVVDFRQRKYVWAVLGLGCALALQLAPIETHAVKVDLPVNR